MKAQELRIGNLLDKNGEICTLSSIHSDNTVRIYSEDKTDTFGCFALRIFKPIPLTEEWLLKFGFEKVKEKNVYFKAFSGRYHFLDLSGIEPRYNMGYDNDGKIQVAIYFLHQLQNLYFALTNQELTLKKALKS